MISAPRTLVVCAGRSLRGAVLRGGFRADLHQQLSAVQVLMPSLRDRLEDLPLLAAMFAEEAVPQREAAGTAPAAVLPEVLPMLRSYAWPGNVAELRAVIAEAALRAGTLPVRPEHLRLPGALLLSSRPGAPARTQIAEYISAPSAFHGLDRSQSDSSPVRGGLQAEAGLYDGHNGDSRAVFPGNAEPRPLAFADSDLPLNPVSKRYSGLSAGLGASRGFDSSLPPAAGPAADLDADPALDANLDRAILRHIRRVLASVDGNKLRAARLLGISRSTLYRLLEAENTRTPGRPALALARPTVPSVLSAER